MPKLNLKNIKVLKLNNPCYFLSSMIKCIFFKTYGMPSMFDTIFIWVPFLSVSHFHKRSKSNDFQLGLNRQKKIEDQIEKKNS